MLLERRHGAFRWSDVLLKGSGSPSEEHEVLGEDAEDEIADLGCLTAGGRG